MYSIRDFKRSTFVKKLNDFSQSMFLAKCLVILGTWFIACIPVYLYILTMWFLSPIEFWKGFAVAVLFIVFLGGPQVILWVLALVMTLWFIFQEIK